MGMQPTVSRSLLVLVVASLLCLPGCSRKGTADVRPRYDAERVTTYELALKTQVNHAVMITGEKGSLDEMLLRFRVELLGTSEAGGASVAMHVDRFLYRNFGQSSQRVDFDDERDDEQNTPPSMTPLFRHVSTMTVTLSMSPDGRASYTAGLEELEAQVVDRSDREALGTVFDRAWWEDQAEAIFRIDAGPSRISVGQTWPRDYAYVEPGYMTVSGLLECEVVMVTEDRVEVEESGGFTVDFADDVFASLEEAAIDQQDIAGRVVWDRRRGRLFEERRDVVLQLSQTWQGMVVAKRHAISRSLRRVSGNQ